MRQTRCIDCNALGRVTSRPAYKPGPRCDEHWRERIRQVSKAAHSKRLEKVYQITAAVYDFILQWQGGVCYGCRKAKGKRRRLAVDHDHKKAEQVCGHDPNMGCPNCIRSLLCAYCNEVIGRLDADALRRLAQVLEDPPAQKALAEMRRHNCE
jgi:hypothetical protein